MLTVENLAFSYGGKAILKGLSFAVAEGEVLHVRGPNGVGKTTLMSILAGLLKEQSGRVTVRGGEADRRRVVEYVPPEANALYARVSAFDNLAYWYALRHGRPDAARIAAELNHWDLRGVVVQKRLPVGKFSTGMKRRLALARLRLAGTPLWLLDEPLYGLDAKGVALFRDALAAHAAEGGAAVIVSHETALLATLPVRALDMARAGGEA